VQDADHADLDVFAVGGDLQDLSTAGEQQVAERNADFPKPA
jgi:hypothetical protein